MTGFFLERALGLQALSNLALCSEVVLALHLYELGTSQVCDACLDTYRAFLWQIDTKHFTVLHSAEGMYLPRPSRSLVVPGGLCCTGVILSPPRNWLAGLLTIPTTGELSPKLLKSLHTVGSSFLAQSPSV